MIFDDPKKHSVSINVVQIPGHMFLQLYGNLKQRKETKIVAIDICDKPGNIKSRSDTYILF
jgi:hypothetical protein